MLPGGFRSTVTQRFVIWFGLLGVAVVLIGATEAIYHDRIQSRVERVTDLSVKSQTLIAAAVQGMSSLSRLELALTQARSGSEAEHAEVQRTATQQAALIQNVVRTLSQGANAHRGRGDFQQNWKEVSDEIESVAAFLKLLQSGVNDKDRRDRMLIDINASEQRLLLALSRLQEAARTGIEGTRTSGLSNDAIYLRHMTFAVMFAALILGLVCIFERLWLVTPIKRYTNALLSPNRRDNNYLERHARRQDEIGVLGEALMGYQQETRRQQALDATERDRLAGEILAQQAQQAAAARFRDTIAAILSNLEGHAARMQSESQHLAGTAAEAERQTLVATSSTSETSRSIEAVSESVSELSRTIGDVHRQIMRATEIVSATNASILEADQKSTHLVSRTQSIEKVIELIQSVAERTNLLSLNATIEAARAGEVGRGFAVVASEIKTLAIQTSRATGDIRSQLQSIVDASESIAEMIRAIVGSIREIDAIAGRIAEAAQHQNAATREIDGIAVRTSDTARRLDLSIGGVAGVVGDASKAAQVVQTISEDLNRQAAALRLSVDQFMQAPAPRAA